MTRAELIQAMELTRRFRVCAYMGETCDCKYGIKGDEKPGDEQTGCPEMRDVIALLRAMNDAEFAEIEERREHMARANYKAALMMFKEKGITLPR
jgi:hypothetical protein